MIKYYTILMHSNEEKIIKKLANRDERTLLLFYRTHHKLLVHFFEKKIGKKDVAEELAQDILIDLIENLRDFRGESSLKTYLFSIARNKIVDYIKKKKLKTIFFSALPFQMVENIMTVFMDDGIERKELSQKIERVITKLPNDYQLIIRLKYMDGERVREIAKKMALPFKATESLLFRARRAFIKAFDTD